MGIDKFKKLSVTDAMKPFLEKHRQKLSELDQEAQKLIEAWQRKNKNCH